MGRNGGEILFKEELAEWAKLVKKKYDTNILQVDKFDDPTVLAQFDPNTNTIKHLADVTQYEMAHEAFHAEEMSKIGFPEYVKDCPLEGVKMDDYTPENWIRLLKREKYVYERIMENKKILNLTENEVEHADLYFGVIKLRMRDRGIKF